MRQRYRWEFTSGSWWSRAPSPSLGAEFHYTSNRPTMPCPSHRYAVTNLSIQNLFSFTTKKLPLCKPFLGRQLGHCKTHIFLCWQIIYPTTQNTFKPEISCICNNPACNTWNIKMGQQRWNSCKSCGFGMVGYINLVIGIPQLVATSLWEERYPWCCSWFCTLLVCRVSTLCTALHNDKNPLTPFPEIQNILINSFLKIRFLWKFTFSVSGRFND